MDDLDIYVPNSLVKDENYWVAIAVNASIEAATLFW